MGPLNGLRFIIMRPSWQTSLHSVTGAGKTCSGLAVGGTAWQNGMVVRAEPQKRIPRVLLCVALSLLLHLLLGVILLLLPPPEPKKCAAAPGRGRAVQVLRTEARRKADAQKQQESPKLPDAPQPDKSFAKTSADTPQTMPDQPDYEGRHSTRAASAPDARHRQSDAPAPAQNGEEKEELVTFDQERQDGDLEHEGKNSASTPPAPQNLSSEPVAPPAEAPAEGLPECSADAQENGEAPETVTLDATRSLPLTPEPVDENSLLREEPDTPLAEQRQQAAPEGMPGGAGTGRPSRPRQQAPTVFYDPSLARQPGFRTHERRSRSSGRFVLGRGAALNVASTPRGMYEALVYRRVAHYWYIACDEHRGDIIPGTITISLRITRRGQIDSMALIRRSGASISQQSFTFKAIRKASLPPMPPEVQAGVIGELMELIFEFNFD